jgi:DNA repair photolyase
MNKPGVPAPGFVKRIGPVVDERRSVEFRPLESSHLVNRLSASRFPFGWTVNPFRGCEFGCRYCYARPTHGYL